MTAINYERIHNNLLPFQNRYKESDDYDALLNDAKGIPFWLTGDQEVHDKLIKDHKLDRGNSNCCFWDLIGRPVKHQPNPLFDYQQIILVALEYFKKIRIKKFRGGGMTQQFLEYASWLTLQSNNFRNKKAFILTGITQELANDHILRMKNTFLQFYPGAIESMDYTQKTLTLNDSIFRAYPAANPEAPRGKTDVFFILADEFDFNTRKVQEDTMSVITPYRPKTDSLIILNSTTKNPEGLYVEMDKDWDEFLKSIDLNKGMIDQHDFLLDHPPLYLEKIRDNIRHHYFLLEFDYLWGLGKIYTEEEIDEVKEDRTFQGEFCLQYAGSEGNVFSPLQIDKAVELGERFKNIPINPMTLHSCGIDPGFGSSKTAIVLTEHLKEEDVIRVIYAQEFDRPNPEEIANLCFDLHRKYFNTWFLVDGSNAGFITTLKIKFGENPKIDYTKSNPNSMKIVPVNFSTEHKTMLSNLHLFINKEYLAIPKQWDKLILSLRTAIAKEYSLDKEQTNYNDSLDALRLSLKGYKMK